jgi:hypothetical protein
MVIWSESLDRIIPLCQDFEERLIKLLWRARPVVHTTSNSSGSPSAAGSYYHGAGGARRSYTGGSVSEVELVEHSGSGSSEAAGGVTVKVKQDRNGAGGVVKGLYGEQGRGVEGGDDPEAASEGDVPMEKTGSDSSTSSRGQGKGYKRTWYGKKVLLPSGEVDEKGVGVLDDVEELRGEGKRPVRLYAPLYNGLAAGIALCMFFFFFFWVISRLN